MPLVSFIVPIYNSMPYLECCLDSLRQQTIDDIEIICVNDCSPDKSKEYIERVMNEDRRIKLVNHTVNRRQGGAWNSGVEIATGDYLSFVDADDWVEYDHCERIMPYLGSDIICARTFLRGDKQSINIDLVRLKECSNDMRLYTLLYGVSFITNFFKRQFLTSSSFHFMENNMYQDFLTNILYFLTDKVCVYEGNSYHYRVDNISIQRSMNQNGFWGRLDVAKVERRELLRIAKKDDYEDAIEYHFYTLFYRNTLTRAFYGYTKINWPVVHSVIQDTKQILPNIKNNQYYKIRFLDYSWLMRMPVIMFEILPANIINIFHFIYIFIRKLLER